MNTAYYSLPTNKGCDEVETTPLFLIMKYVAFVRVHFTPNARLLSVVTNLIGLQLSNANNKHHMKRTKKDLIH